MVCDQRRHDLPALLRDPQCGSVVEVEADATALRFGLHGLMEGIQ